MKTVALLTLLVLVVASGSASAAALSGKVLFNPGGAPVPRALVEFRAGSAQARAVTLDDGSFYIPELAGSSFQVTVTYRGAKTALGEVPWQKFMALKIAH